MEFIANIIQSVARAQEIHQGNPYSLKIYFLHASGTRNLNFQDMVLAES